MAINPASKYPGHIRAADVAYPYGSARNVTLAGDGTGTPLEEAWVNDLFGIEQSLLNDLGVAPNGNPESLSNAQILTSIKRSKELQLLAEIRSKVGSYNGEIRYLVGRSAINDGGEGYFVWDASSTTADDGGTVYQPGVLATGRWKRLGMNGISMPAWYGLSFSAWITATGSANVSTVLISDVTITGTVTVPSNIAIIGFYNNAKFTGTGALTINNMPCEPRHQIFDSTLSSVTLNRELGRPEWWGCTYDGTTVDSTAIQRCMSSGVGHTKLNNGTCRTNTPLQPPNNHIISGSGKTILKSVDSQNWVSQGIIHLVNKSFVTITDLEIDGNNANNTVGRSHGISIVRGSHDITVERVYSHNNPSSTLTGGTGGDGVYIASGDYSVEPPVFVQPYNIVIRDCNLSSNVRQCISIVGGLKVKIVNNQLINTTGSDPGAGIDLEPDSSAATSDTIDILISGNTITGNRHGVLLFNAQQAVFKDIVITDNVINDCDEYGIEVVGCSNGFIISNNRIVNCVSDGIRIMNDSSDGIISDNIISNNTANGINILTGSRRHQIHGNIIHRNGRHGIITDYVFSGNNRFFIYKNSICNNSVSSTSTYDGIYVTGNATHSNANHIIVDNIIGNYSDINATATQRNGINVEAGADGITITNNIIIGNTGSPVVNPSSNAIVYVGSQGNIRTAITSNNSEKMTILPNGNVGVNNTNPLALIDVAGTISTPPKIRATTTDNPTAINQTGGELIVGLETRSAKVRSKCETNFTGGEAWATEPRVGIGFEVQAPGGVNANCGISNLGVGYFDGLKINNGGFVYLYGDVSTNGSSRLGYDTGSIVLQKRISGSWVEHQSFTDGAIKSISGIGMFNVVPPSSQPIHIADVAVASGATPTKAEYDDLVGKFNTVLARMESYGMQASS